MTKQSEKYYNQLSPQQPDRDELETLRTETLELEAIVLPFYKRKKGVDPDLRACEEMGF